MLALKRGAASMGAAVSITRLELTAAQLRAAAGREKDGSAARRMLAIAMVLDGADRGTAAETCGMDRQTLRDWVHRYNAEGIRGLHDLKTPGPKPKLTADQQAKLAELVEAGPDPARHGVVRWRRVDLRDELQRCFGVVLHERSVGKVLAKLGYCRLSVRPRHPQTDEAAQEAFKKTSPQRSRHGSPTTPKTSPSKSGSRTRHASASKARGPASGPNEAHGPARRAISATNGPTSSAPSVRNAAPRRPSSSQPPTPRSCRCIWPRSAGKSRRAAMPPSCSMARAITSPKTSPSRTTSPSSICRPTHPNSTRSKMYGNICAATNSRSQSSKATMISSTRLATPGHSLPTIMTASHPSQHDLGHRSFLRAVGIMDADEIVTV